MKLLPLNNEIDYLELLKDFSMSFADLQSMQCNVESDAHIHYELNLNSIKCVKESFVDHLRPIHQT